MPAVESSSEITSVSLLNIHKRVAATINIKPEPSKKFGTESIILFVEFCVTVDYRSPMTLKQKVDDQPSIITSCIEVSKTMKKKVPESKLHRQKTSTKVLTRMVDSLYFPKFGRRKSWLVPIQYCLGISTLLVSLFADKLIGSKTTPPDIFGLTLSFFLLVLFTATQDVIIDGWSLTMLSRRNIHYAPSCEVVGFILGAFLSNTVLLALESADFCNQWLRKTPQETGILSVPTFMRGCGIVFLVVATLVWIFKKERDVVSDDDPTDGVID
ncbi:acetyl-coenzyme A transporter 1-like protein, partial [Dinothrombium tinctorium]